MHVLNLDRKSFFFFLQESLGLGVLAVEREDLQGWGCILSCCQAGWTSGICLDDLHRLPLPWFLFSPFCLSVLAT